MLLKYDSTHWGVALATDRLNGGPGAFAGLVSSSLRDTRTMFNGYYKFDALSLGVGVMQRENEAKPLDPKSNLSYVQASYKVTPTFILDGGVMKLDFKNSANGATMYAVRGTYLLSKRTAVYGSLANLSNAGQSTFSVSGGSPVGNAPAAGQAQSGVMVGVRHTF